MTWTRVRDKKTGHQFSVANVDEDKHVVLDDKAATDASGRPLPPLPKTTKGKAITAPPTADDGPKAGEKGSA